MILGLLTILSYARYKIANMVDWRLPSDTHILFMGASHVYHAIDDSLIPGAINFGQPSERYLYTYVKLRKILKANTQVDTVVLQCSSTDLWQDTDYKYFTKNEQSLFVKDYWPLFTSSEWNYILGKGELLQPMTIIVKNLVCRELFSPSAQLSHIGRYAGIIEGSVSFDKAGIKQDLEVNHISEYGDYGTEINYHYLREIATLCKTNNIKLILVYYPVFRPELYYDQDYCEDIRMELFSDIEYHDYSNWYCKDEERLDAHHLNHRGAQRFTKFIKEELNM